MSLVSNQLQAKWEPYDNGPHQGCVSSIFKKGDSIYVSLEGRNSILYYSSDNGINWKQIGIGLPDYAINSVVVHDNYLLAALSGGGVYLSSNNGSNWESVNNGLNSLYVFSFTISGDKIYVGTDDGVYQSINNGINWASIGLSTHFITNIIINNSDIFASSPIDGIFFTQNNGGLWSQKNLGLTNLNVTSLLLNGGNFYAGTNSGLFVSNDYGSNWNEINSNVISPKVYSIKSTGSNIYMATQEGLFLSINNGSSWIQIKNGLTEQNIRCLLIDNTLFLAGTFMGIFRSIDQGISWNSTGFNLESLTFCTKHNQTLVAAGYSSSIFISTDNGINWRNCKNNLPYDTYFSAAINNSGIYVGTASYGVYKSIDSGLTWTPINNGITNYWVTSLVAKGSLIFAGTNDGVFFSGNNGSSWLPRNNGIDQPMIVNMIVCDSTALAVSVSGFFSSKDDGLNWTPITDIYPGVRYLSAEGKKILTSCSCGHDSSVWLSVDEGNNWSPATGNLRLEVSYSLAAYDNTLFVGTSNSGVYYSIDNGSNWYTINEGLPANSGIKTIFTTDNYLYASTLYQGLYRRPLSEIYTGENVINDNPFFKIYPNPTTGKIKIEIIEKSPCESYIIKIYDVYGKLIDKYDLTNSLIKELSLNKISKGIYFVNIKSGIKSYTQKIIINN